MARMMNALQLALGSVGSGIQGYAQARAQREEQERKQAELEQEQSRVAAAFERQSRMDAMTMEDREQAKQDRLQAQRVALLKGGYVPEGMDMPGATPRKAVNTEVVDGKRYSMYSTPQQMAIQAAMEEAALKKKLAPEDKLTAWEKQQVLDKAADRSSRERIASGRSSAGTSGGAGGLSAKAREAMRTAEAWFNAPNNDPAQVKLARDVFVALRESRPDAAPQELMLDAYNAVKEQMKMANTAAQISQRQRSNQPKAGGRTLSAPPGMAKPAAAENDIFDTEWEKYNKGGK